MRMIAVFLDDARFKEGHKPGSVAACRHRGVRRLARSSEDSLDVPDRFRCALLSALPSAARNPAAGPDPGAADGPGPAGCHDPVGVERELVERLLKAVERSSPRGKRDYAILLLASRLGLRLGDIRMLTLDALKWDTAAIEITQSKTGAPLCLPLTEEVGQALIDYRTGCPQTAHRELFLRAQPPFTPFAADGHFYNIVKYWRELAGIRFRSKQHCGLHSLRHTLATQLLREQTPMHVISEILGHTTTATTMIYAKADAVVAACRRAEHRGAASWRLANSGFGSKALSPRHSSPFRRNRRVATDSSKASGCSGVLIAI